MLMELQEIQIASKYDRDGRMVLMDGALIAVLVKLSDVHADLTGHWFWKRAALRYETSSLRFPICKQQTAIVWIEAEVGRNCCPE
jgi:hypothetical protein